MTEHGGRHNHFGVVTAFEDLQVGPASQGRFNPNPNLARFKRGRIWISSTTIFSLPWRTAACTPVFYNNFRMEMKQVPPNGRTRHCAVAVQFPRTMALTSGVMGGSLICWVKLVSNAQPRVGTA